MSGPPIKTEAESPWRHRANVVLISLFAVTAFSMTVIIALSIVMPPVLSNVVESYTDEAPLQLEVAVLTELERSDIETRLENFEAGFDSDEVRVPLTLTESEINGLLQDEEDLNGRLSVSFVGDLVEARLSLPIEQDLEIGPWTSGMKGRYLNGVAVLKPKLTAEGLILELKDFRVKNKSVPGWMLSQLQGEIDGLEWLQSDDVRDTISRLSDVVISDNELVLYPKNP